MMQPICGRCRHPMRLGDTDAPNTLASVAVPTLSLPTACPELFKIAPITAHNEKEC